jgi:hypothetical protein
VKNDKVICSLKIEEREVKMPEEKKAIRPYHLSETPAEDSAFHVKSISSNRNSDDLEYAINEWFKKAGPIKIKKIVELPDCGAGEGNKRVDRWALIFSYQGQEINLSEDQDVALRARVFSDNSDKKMANKIEAWMKDERPVDLVEMKNITRIKEAKCERWVILIIYKKKIRPE